MILRLVLQASLAISAGAIATAADQPVDPRDAARTFTATDTNADGKVVRTEFEAVAPRLIASIPWFARSRTTTDPGTIGKAIDAAFAKPDADRSSSLEPGEFADGLDAFITVIGLKPPPRATTTTADAADATTGR